MSVDSATLSTASGLLKYNYEGPIVDQVNNPNAMMAEVDKNSKDIVQGSRIVMAVQLRPTQAIGARAELGTLPAAQRTFVDQPYEVLKSLYGVMRVTGQLMEASKTDKGAFVRAISSEAKGLTLALKLDQNRQVWGSEANDGRVVLLDAASTSTRTIALPVGTNMAYFEIGMLIDLRTASSGTVITDGTSREVVGIDTTPSAPTITIDSDGNVVTTANTTAIFRAGNRNQEINGLEALIGTSTLHNLNPATAGNERWKSTVKTGFGAFSSSKLQEVIDAANNASGEWVDRIYSQHPLRNAYLAELQGMRRIVGQVSSADDKKLNAGFSGLSYTGGGAEAVWVKDPYAPNAGSIYGIKMSWIELKQADDWGFIEAPGQAGNYWLPDIYGSSGVDAYKAVMKKYCNLVTKKRSAHFKIQGATA